MAIKIGELIAKLRTETSDFEKGMFRSLTKVEALKLGLRAVTKTLQFTARFLKESAKAAGVQEQAMTDLTAALQRAGVDGAQAAAEDFAQYAAQLQEVTTVGDEAAIQSAAIAASFGIQGDQLKQTTQAAADLSAVTGVSLKSAMLILGKAAKGETSTLSRYGIVIDKNLAPSEKFAGALAAINEQFGGAAQAKAKTFNGRLIQLQNAWGDLQESLGAAVQNNELVNATLEILTQNVGNLTDFTKDNEEQLKSWVNKGWFVVFKAIDLVIGAGGKLLQFFKALQIIGTGALLLLAKGWQIQLKVVETLLAPLSDVLDALVAVGKINVNPLAAGFAKVSNVVDPLVASTAELLQEQIKAFDKIGANTDALRGRLKILQGEIAKTASKTEQGSVKQVAATDAATDAVKKQIEAQEEAKTNIEDSIGLALRLGDAFSNIAIAATEGQNQLKEAIKSTALTALDVIQDVVTKSITARAAEAAAGAAASQAGIPVVGPILAAAAAGAMFGLVRGFLTKFAKGGEVTGGVRGRDSVPALLTPGEVVLSVPVVRALKQMMSLGVGSLGMQTGGLAREQMAMAGFGGLTVVVQSPVGPTTSEIDRIVSKGILRSQQRLSAQGLI